jgi:exopolysaccharide biosynthesis polyprenyl glycosylphosphotransferase
MGKSHLKVAPLRDQTLRLASGPSVLADAGHLPAGRDTILKEEIFQAMLKLERRRAERSGRPFVLMLFDSGPIRNHGRNVGFAERLASVVRRATRETDLVGWYEDGTILAVIFTEINLEGTSPITEVLYSKVVKALQENLDHKLASKLAITVHLFPESWDKDHPDRVADIKLYPDLSQKGLKKQFPTVVKRSIDVLGSGILLLILFPVLAAIALAIKLSSRGPIIFKQERLGQFGRRFKCLKFRTMYTDNDPKIHREYALSFIAGKTETQEKDEAEPTVYKIKNDPRVTPVGRFLRKTSLDELPQFWNVLSGDMSLVGPRPPVPYEFEVYDFWHRRRVLEVRPGVTGLWQVSGRSRIRFNDMVRLDLRYAERWSLWLDFKILLATPRAVFTGDGAY